MAHGGIGSDTVSDPWKKSRSRMLNLSQVTSACATIFNLHCQIFHCHDNFCVCHPVRCFNPALLWVVLFFYSYCFALLMLFSECHALCSLCAPSLGAPLDSPCPAFFVCFFFFLVSIIFTHFHFSSPRLDAMSTPLDWTLSQCPLTECQVNTPWLHATSTPLNHMPRQCTWPCRSQAMPHRCSWALHALPCLLHLRVVLWLRTGLPIYMY